ncbi:MAG: copper amine oxidase N-terminal domain-containing protein [Cytophagales bacterium]|nr:copper amine oxidase N-terminal domain-containing protein [Armatimonadota bacterium]
MKSPTCRAISSTLTIAALSAVAALPAAAQNINVTVDGDVVSFAGQQPVQRFGSVLVPLRGVFEKLGATVAYDGATKTILALKGSTSVQLQIGGTAAQVNGQARTLSSPAQAVNGTTLVPLRFVSEALGAEVKWSAASRTVVIATIRGGTRGSGDSAPAAPGSSPVEITSLTHSATRALRAGDSLTVTLQGTPGGAATLNVPGIDAARNVPLSETTPGTYVGSFTVPRGINSKGASLLATLKKGGATSPTFQSGQPLIVDTVGPTLTSLSPAPNATLAPGKPLIYGTFSDAGEGVATGGARLLVNGKDVTDQATITEAFFSYRPDTDLPNGKNTAVAIVQDDAGNETRREWGFTLSPSEALIKELTFSPDTKTLEPGDELTVTVTAQPGGKARFALGGAVTDRVLNEGAAGVYTGTYTVRKGDSLAQAPITVTFTSASGRTVTQSANQSVTIAAGAPDKPTITSPQPGTPVGGDTITLAGKAKPNATVRYHLRYEGTLIIIPASGTVTEGEVKADAQGNWSVPNIKLSSPSGVRSLTYTASVEAIGAAGEVSETSSVAFQK